MHGLRIMSSFVSHESVSYSHSTKIVLKTTVFMQNIHPRPHSCGDLFRYTMRYSVKYLLKAIKNAKFLGLNFRCVADLSKERNTWHIIELKCEMAGI